MERHDFFKLLGAVKDSLAHDYKRIRAKSLEDPGTAGDQAEEDWAKILRNWLPATYPVITKGRILFEDGTSSPQVDVLVLKPSYPLGLRQEKYVFVGGVVAAFECKLTLRKQHIEDAFKTASKIKRKAKARYGTPYDELNCLPIFGLLAHSHSLRGKNPSWKIHEFVEEFERRHAKKPRELLDIICVADAVTLPLSKDVVIGNDLEEYEIQLLKEANAKSLITTMYVINDEHRKNPDDVGAILGSLIFDITNRIAFEDISVRDWAEHLSMLGFYGGIGRHVYWTEDELSYEVRMKLKETGRDNSAWSKWAGNFP